MIKGECVMESLHKIGFAKYYLLDTRNNKIYNEVRNKYVKETGEYRYRLRDDNGKIKSVTMKEIYKKLYNKVFCIDNIERLEGEEFREIRNSEGNYYISNMGRVLSYSKNYAMIMKPYREANGYEKVMLYLKDGRKNKLVHSLVCNAFMEVPKDIDILNLSCHHKDYCKHNNRLDNLQLLSNQEHRTIHNKRRLEENGSC